MSTRSNIGYINDEGKIRAAYCHYDGYLEHNGRILFDYYTDAAKVKELVELGDMSVLGSKIHPTPGSGHDFDNNENDVTVFYGRDRGENDVAPVTYDTISKWVNRKDSWEEYYYLFMPELGTWMVYSVHNKRWKQVTEDLIKQEA
jgi:hypothetical protein